LERRNAIRDKIRDVFAWQQMESGFRLFNDIGCREDLPRPALRGDQRIDQRLPVDECGQPAACRLQAFIQVRKPQVEDIVAGLEALPASTKDQETLSRIDGLRHLLAKPPGTPFEGEKCYHCGDALICLEAPLGYTVATKNRRHFEPLALILGKRLSVAETARTAT
jgi:hypothetical protein